MHGGRDEITKLGMIDHVDESAGLARVGRDRGVDACVIRCRDDQRGLAEMLSGVTGSSDSQQLARRRQRLDLVADGRGDDVNGRSSVEERSHLARRDRTTANHQRRNSRSLEDDRVRAHRNCPAPGPAILNAT